jgi:hypothetical protein
MSGRQPAMRGADPGASDPGSFPGGDAIPHLQDAWACAGLTVAWLIPILVIGVEGDFPLNDDWAFARTAWHLLETGSFERVKWVYATAIPTTAWGALFSMVLGPTFEALRWSGLVMGWAGVLGAYALCREAGARVGGALLGAGTVAANPLYLNLAFSFMSDVPFAAFCTWALAFGVRGIRLRSRRAFVAAALFAALAIATRQPGIALIIAAGAAAASAGSAWRKRQILWGLGGLAALAAGWIVLVALQGPDEVGQPFTLTRYVRQFLLGDHAYYHLIVNASGALPYLGLMLLPLLIWSRHSSQRDRLLERIALVAGGLAFLALAGAGLRMPLGINVLHDTGLGPITLHGCQAVFARPVATTPWWIATAAGCLGAGAMLCHLGLGALRAWPNTRERPVGLLLLGFAAISLAGLAVRSPFFDRYLVVMLAPLSALLVAGANFLPARSMRRVASWVCLAGIATFSIFATRDYLEHHRARWSLLSPLLEQEISPRRIDGGFEFGGLHVFGQYEPKWAWVIHDQFLVSYEPSVEGFTALESRSYRRLLPPHRETVTLHLRDGQGEWNPQRSPRCRRPR